MDGRINNKGVKGNQGGGRSSAYLEQQDAEWHAAIWKEDQDIDVLRKKLESGRYCVRDVAALKALQGDHRVLCKIMDKILPDLSHTAMQASLGHNEIKLSEAEKEKIEQLFKQR